MSFGGYWLLFVFSYASVDPGGLIASFYDTDIPNIYMLQSCNC